MFEKTAAFTFCGSSSPPFEAEFSEKIPIFEYEFEWFI